MNNPRPPDRPTQPKGPRSAAEVGDATLIRRFLNRRDEAAFATLVERYGPLVMGVCLRVLGQRQDAEDAFQTTFLVLARKAGSIARRQSVSGWIYRVAYRVALRARATRARRASRVRRLTEVAAPEETPAWVCRELRPILDEEVNRLPRKYRLPFILCYLQGQTNAEAAEELRCPAGTVMSRLAWARERLRRRLTRRGITLSAGALAVFLAERTASAGESAPPVGPTVANVVRFTAGGAGGVAARLAVPAEEILRAMAWAQWLKAGAALLGGVGAAILGWVVVMPVLLGGGAAGRPVATPLLAEQQKLQGAWRPERVEIGGQGFPAAGMQVIFSGDRFQLMSADGPAMAARFVLNPDARPPTMDLHFATGETWPGIYQLDGDLLFVSYNVQGQRPRDFDSSASPRTILYRLRR
jgi:RNA polymerase sigma factor (sigma-70 family)